MRFRRAVKRGFSLVELVVVVVIIGLLAAVGIVAYRGLTASAGDAAVQDNLRSAGLAMQLEITKSGAFPNNLVTLEGLEYFSPYRNERVSGGGSAITSFTADSASHNFCIAATNIESGNTFKFNSTDGRVTPGTCPSGDVYEEMVYPTSFVAGLVPDGSGYNMLYTASGGFLISVADLSVSILNVTGSFTTANGTFPVRSWTDWGAWEDQGFIGISGNVYYDDGDADWATQTSSAAFVGLSSGAPMSTTLTFELSDGTVKTLTGTNTTLHNMGSFGTASVTPSGHIDVTFNSAPSAYAASATTGSLLSCGDSANGVYPDATFSFTVPQSGSTATVTGNDGSPLPSGEYECQLDVYGPKGSVAVGWVTSIIVP